MASSSRAELPSRHIGGSLSEFVYVKCAKCEKPVTQWGRFASEWLCQEHAMTIDPTLSPDEQAVANAAGSCLRTARANGVESMTIAVKLPGGGDAVVRVAVKHKACS